MRQADKYTHGGCLVVILTHSLGCLSACILYPHKLWSVHFAKTKPSLQKWSMACLKFSSSSSWSDKTKGKNNDGFEKQALQRTPTFGNGNLQIIQVA